MTEIQTVIAGSGAQEVWAYATNALGQITVPATATAQIVDLTLAEGATGRVVLASGAAEIDDASTTTTAAAGPRELEPSRIAVTDSSGFVVGRRYLLRYAGLDEAFEVARVTTGFLYTRDTLRAGFPSGSSVIGCRVSVEFPAATANDAAELARRALFGIDWTFTGITGPSPIRTLARIERRGRPPRALVEDLLLLDPNLAAATQGRIVLESHLAQADRELDALLLCRGDVLPDSTQGELGKIAVCWRALALTYLVLGQQYEDRSVRAQREADRWTKMVIEGHRRDDAIELERSTDRQRPRRTRIGIGI